MAGPLEGVRVVELGGIGPVPHAGMMLADLGAEVIQITRPGTVADPATRADILNRGKLSMAVDLKAEEGASLTLELVAGSQVLIEGFRPGVAERLGVGPEDCRAVNRALVYGRMTGWGQKGPLAQAAGHDIDYIAVSGALGAIGPAERPYPPLNLVGDFGGGSMLLLAGVLAALVRAGVSGEGDVVDAAMVDGSALLMAMHHGAMAGGWWSGQRGHDLFDGSAPFYTTYETADGRWVAVGALEPHFYAQLLAGLEMSPDDLPGQMERERWPDTREEMARRFRRRTRAEWEAVFSETDACVVGVYDMREAPSHPHNRSRSSFVEADGIVQPAPAPRLASFGRATPGRIPDPGQHTAVLLERLGVGPEAASRLARNGVVQLEEQR